MLHIDEGCVLEGWGACIQVRSALAVLGRVSMCAVSMHSIKKVEIGCIRGCGRGRGSGRGSGRGCGNGRGCGCGCECLRKSLLCNRYMELNGYFCKERVRSSIPLTLSVKVIAQVIERQTTYARVMLSVYCAEN